VDRSRARTIGPVGLGFLLIGLAGPSSDNSVAPPMKGTDMVGAAHRFVQTTVTSNAARFRVTSSKVGQAQVVRRRKSGAETVSWSSRGLQHPMVAPEAPLAKRARIGLCRPIVSRRRRLMPCYPRYATSEQRTQSPIQLVGCPCQAGNPHVTGNHRNCIRKINAPLVECRTSQGD
jgi:hypothetical protein